ncbi:hypothetical protein HMPREF2134_14755 [Peptoniphilus lacrimalis DNF00528]|nr:hypothetical protein HMPREF2134_14755 [Peptoniphilus lacrimalis DNF00528]
MSLFYVALVMINYQIKKTIEFLIAIASDYLIFIFLYIDFIVQINNSIDPIIKMKLGFITNPSFIISVFF